MRDIIFVDSMAVDEKYRGKGIGHAFFDFLKELNVQKGYDGIELQVNAKNQAAYKFYSNYGFTNNQSIWSCYKFHFIVSCGSLIQKAAAECFQEILKQSGTVP